jgi:Kef-type K+ transport system membrane component KefB
LGAFLHPRFAEEGVSRLHFMAFMGIAMSITAFPVLARILNERGLLVTKLGTLALACAAVNDAAGWSLLAAVVLLARSQGVYFTIALTFLGLLAFGLVLAFGVRPLLKRMVDVYGRRGSLSNDLMALLLLLVCASALASEALGVHALFGAFALGVIVPRRSDFVRAIVGKMHDLVTVLFLPLFFALTGLKTRIGLLTGAETWLYCALILAVAILGKFGGTTAAARLNGLPWREAGALGVLMNTRGLMELVILNIGLEIGIISPSVFTMMVVMALLTTVMASPLLDWIYPTPSVEEKAASGRLVEETV